MTTKEKDTQKKTFEEISQLYRKAEILYNDIKLFDNVLKQLNEIVLKRKDTALNTDNNGNITSESDTENYELIIYGCNKNVICKFKNLELIKECSAVIARASLTARNSKETELNKILQKLKN